MRFLEGNEVSEWCTEHGIGVDEDRRPVPPPFRVVSRGTYAEGGRSGREKSVAEDLVPPLGTWSECLLLPLQWGIWGSGEDWPAYYAARGARGERRSLEKAPGHLFAAGESASLVAFLTMVMENGWDAHVLPVQAGKLGPIHMFVSHDEWFELRAGDSG